MLAAAASKIVSTLVIKNEVPRLQRPEACCLIRFVSSVT
jgi:hypothetical protein